VNTEITSTDNSGSGPGNFGVLQWRKLQQHLLWYSSSVLIRAIQSSAHTQYDIANPNSSISSSSISKGRERLIGNDSEVLRLLAKENDPRINAFVKLYAPKRKTTYGWAEFNKHGFV
jgi:hypothetical protein